MGWPARWFLGTRHRAARFPRPAPSRADTETEEAIMANNDQQNQQGNQGGGQQGGGQQKPGQQTQNPGQQTPGQQGGGQQKPDQQGEKR
jgi:hypothetical protein